MSDARRLLRTWLPTALGSSMLVAEIPVVSTAVARTPDGASALAAFGVAISVLVVVNSPALALAPLVVMARPSVRVRRYALAVGVLGCAVLGAAALNAHGLSAVLGLDPALTGQLRAALLALSAAPLAVALRRYLQGRLMDAGATAGIGVATGVRLGLSAATAWALVAAGATTGAGAGGVALTVGAFAEATVLARAVRRLGHPSTVDGLARPRLLVRHAQLSVSRLLVMVPPLVITVGIAHSARATDSLVVWPALYGLLSLFAGPLNDLETVVAVTLRRDRADPAPRRVALWLVVTLLLGYGLVVLSPVTRWYLVGFVGVPAGPASLGVAWAVLTLPVPVLFVVRGYLRGVTMAADRAARLVPAVVAHLVPLAAVLALLSRTGLPGVAVAAVSLAAGVAAETGWLAAARIPRVVDRAAAPAEGS
jgi:hypothetical protein